MHERRDQGQSDGEADCRQAAPPADVTDAGTESEAVVFVRATCGVPRTGPPHAASGASRGAVLRVAGRRRTRSVVCNGSSGRYAIETEPYGAPLVVAEVRRPVMLRGGVHYNADGKPLVSQGPRGDIVINPDDARGLEWRHASAACCGANPDGGMNRLCGGSGTREHG